MSGRSALARKKKELLTQRTRSWPHEADELRLVEDKYPTYNLTKETLGAFLRHLFGEGDHIVAIKYDSYVLRIPRYLSVEERIAINKLRDDLGDFRRAHSSSPEPGLVTDDENTANNSHHIPLISPSTEGKLIIEEESSEGVTSFEVITSQVDIDELRTSGYLYGARLDEGITCEVYEVTANWAWISSETARRTEKHTVKVRRLLLKFLIRYSNLLY